MRFPYRSIQTACYYKENPPVPIWRQKPCEYIGKVPYFKANPKASPKARENLYLVIHPPRVSV